MYLFFTAVLSAFIVFCVVYPLWYSATASSRIYTILLITLFLLCVLFKTGRKIFLNYKNKKTEEERKKYCKKFICTLSAAILIILTVFLSVWSVLSGQRLIALIIFTSGVVLTSLVIRYRKRYSDA